MSRPYKRHPLPIGEMALLCVQSSPLVLRPFLITASAPTPEGLRYSGILFLNGDQDRYEWLRRFLFMLPTKQLPLTFLSGIPEGKSEGQLRRRT